MAKRIGGVMLRNPDRSISVDNATDLLFQFTIGGLIPFFGERVKREFSIDDILELIRSVIKEPGNIE